MSSGPERRTDAGGPQTLKGVLDRVLTDARAAGRLPEAMRLLGDGELRLAQLAARLGLDRRTGTVGGRPFPTAALITALDADTVTLTGRWGPDLLERAGARPLGPAPGEADAVWSWEALGGAAPAVVILAISGELPVDVGDRIRKGVPGVRVCALDGALVNRPGPALVRTVELLAEAVHGAASGVEAGPDAPRPL